MPFRNTATATAAATHFAWRDFDTNLARRAALLDYIRAYRAATDGMSPSTPEMLDHLLALPAGHPARLTSRTAVGKHLTWLETRGFLTRAPARTITTPDGTRRTVAVYRGLRPTGRTNIDAVMRDEAEARIAAASRIQSLHITGLS